MNGMTTEHAQALNRVLAVGGLRSELAAIVKRAGEYAGLGEQERQRVYERYLAVGEHAVLRAGKPWGAWAADFADDLLAALRLR